MVTADTYTESVQDYHTFSPPTPTKPIEALLKIWKRAHYTSPSSCNPKEILKRFILIITLKSAAALTS
jgi:hypothetical protein